MRPKSVIFSTKRDEEHPRHFHMKALIGEQRNPHKMNLLPKAILHPSKIEQFQLSV